MYSHYNRPVIGKSKSSRSKSKAHNLALVKNHIDTVRKSNSNTNFELGVDYSDKQMMFDNLYHIVYIIKHKRSGCRYVGIHSSEHNDVFTEYFTSSKLIHKIIDIEGDYSFEYEHAIYTRTRDIAKIIERDLIKLNWSYKSSLNRSYEAVNGTIFHVKYSQNYMGIPTHECCVNNGKPNKKQMNYGSNLILPWIR